MAIEIQRCPKSTNLTAGKWNLRLRGELINFEKMNSRTLVNEDTCFGMNFEILGDLEGLREVGPSFCFLIIIQKRFTCKL